MNLQVILAPYMSIPSAFVFFENAGGVVQDPYCGAVYKDGTVVLEPFFVSDMNWKRIDHDNVYAYVACEHPKRWVAHVLPSEKELLGGDTALYQELLESLSADGFGA
jgi:hypothetical protein